MSNCQTHRRTFACFLTVLFLAGWTAAGASDASAGEPPPITAGVPFFYYSDLREAVDWYQNKLGLEVLTDKEWVVIFRVNEGSYLGLVNATGGYIVEFYRWVPEHSPYAK